MNTKKRPLAHKLLYIYMLLCSIIVTAYLIFFAYSILMFSFGITKNETIPQKDCIGALVIDLSIPKYSKNGKIKEIIKAKKGIGLGEGRLFLEDILIEEIDENGKAKSTRNMDYAILMVNDQSIIEIKKSNKIESPD